MTDVVGTLKTFAQKFNNDWSMNLAGMLTYSLITTIFPILAAILTVAGLVLRALSPSSLNALASSLSSVIPSGIVKPHDLLNGLVTLTGPLAIVSIVGLIWAGSNLFTNVENAFSIVFRVKDRDFLPQRLMAVGMVIILAILLPLAFAASSLVTAGSQAFQSALPSPLGVLLSVVGPLASLAILWALFLAIYMVVPNITVPFRDAWRGALVAAVLFALVTLLFPTYIKIFLNGNAKYGATALTLLLLIAWLWFFALILMIGAQVNAVALGLKPLPQDVPRTIATEYSEAEAGIKHLPSRSTRPAAAPGPGHSDQPGRLGTPGAGAGST